MRKPQSLPTVWWIVIGLGLFLVSGSYAFRFARDEWVRITHSQLTLTQLQGMVQSTEAEREGMKSLAVGEATAPGHLLSEVRISGELTFGDPVVRELSDGIRYQQVLLEISGVDPSDIYGLLRTLENSQPPWRVTRLELETHEGTLQGVIQVEALDKAAPTP